MYSNFPQIFNAPGFAKLWKDGSFCICFARLWEFTCVPEKTEYRSRQKKRIFASFEKTFAYLW